MVVELIVEGLLDVWGMLWVDPALVEVILDGTSFVPFVGLLLEAGVVVLVEELLEVGVAVVT